MAKTDGGSAFPVVEAIDSFPDSFDLHAVLSSPGMTLRDWFAGQALAGWMAGPSNTHPGIDGPEGRGAQNLARWSYAMADAMRAAREVSGE